MGLEVNSTKSVIFFFQARESKNEISSIFDYHVESSPHRLFGSSFEFKKLLYAMYLPLIKLELSSWAPQVWHTEPSTQESSLLFDVGCLQLIKKILSAMSRLLHLSSSRGSSIIFLSFNQLFFGKERLNATISTMLIEGKSANYLLRRSWSS